MNNNHSQIVSFIWSIADDVLRDVFLRGQYRDVILPMVVLRRLDALLEPTKQEVEEEIQESGINNIDEGVLKDITGLSYFNTSKWTLNRLKSQASDNNDLLYDNFVEYLNGYSENVRDVLRNFEYYTKARKLADNDRLLSMIEKITDPHINLTDKEAHDPDGMHRGNTITDDHFRGQSFGFQLTNPPYGKSWKTDKEKIYHEKTLLDSRFELPLTNYAGDEEVLDCTPRTSDGQLLFMLEEIDKMKPLDQQPQGSRVASIHNGSSLFTGDAGSGESNIRRYVVENDLIDAIVQLPNNIFYNTGITTYVWLLTNKKPATRQGKVQLIDASRAFEKLRKNQGSRNCTITPEYRDLIVKTYMDFVEVENDKIASKIFDGDDFRYYNVTIERPLRLRCQMNALKVDELLFDKGEAELSRWLYQTYGERVFKGLDNELPTIKEYLNDNDIKLTDKKLAKLISVKDWNARQALKQAAQSLLRAVGTEVYMDYNIFYDLLSNAAKQQKLDLQPATLKAIARAMSEPDPDAAPVVKKEHKATSKEIEELTEVYGIARERLGDYGFYPVKKGMWVEYETDSDLRDAEKIPVKEDIYQYFLREVRPYVADAWINLPPTKIGCEISFNKYFYKPTPLRTLEENERDILELDRQSQGFIQSLFETA